MFNPAKAADEIKKEFIGYISTTYRFRNQRIQQRLLAELDKTVSKGPFVEIKDSFKSGKSINELIDEGVLSPLFKDLEKDKKYHAKLPLERPLYFHQEKAIQKIANGKNVVVSTGTGSGKTHCFLIPVINELLREKEKGTLNDGVRAIFIYPMNALANDQIKGLREILMDYPDIRFGVYNGGTENKEDAAIRLYEAMFANEKYPELRKRLPNEEVSRDAMKKHPPHILFTNYAMLEHMLFRPGDDTIFSNSNFKFVVLDEAHVYTGATGIETSFLMGRLKGRMSSNRSPQFILTSATLGDGSEKSNQQVVEFAKQLTGCHYEVSDIIGADRDNSIKTTQIFDYPIQLFTDLANEELFFDDILKKHNLNFNYSPDKEPSILYDILASSTQYVKMRANGGLIKLQDFASLLGITQDEAVAFIALCAKARKSGKALIDIRYHFFLRALDGCYLALDHPESLSLIRKDSFHSSFDTDIKMFEVATCDDCGEIALVGKIVNDHLVRAGFAEERVFFQIKNEWTELSDEDAVPDYILCKNCGAIVAEDESHNNWCTCGKTEAVKLVQIPNNKDTCQNCGGTLRRFNLGYDTATGVIATSLYEQIPEYTITIDASQEETTKTSNIFLQHTRREKIKTSTGSQFLVFSDSRQGAAKFACFLEDMYKQFLRRRGIWNVINETQQEYTDGIFINEFVELLRNYYSSKNLFRKNNTADAASSSVENRRNAWVAVLDELYNSNRSTSLVSLGKISFEYAGITPEIVQAISSNYKISEDTAYNYLNYLAFEIVRAGAIVTDKDTDINDSDRAYLYFSPTQKVAIAHIDKDIYNAVHFVPASHTLKNGDRRYYKSNKLRITSMLLNISEDESVKLIEGFWDYLISNENPFHLAPTGKGYCMKASSIRMFLGENSKLWQCQKCEKVTQFNINDKCQHAGCSGHLERIHGEEFCKDNYYAKLYETSKITPLFVKEHTAQLAKKDALDYQQQFIRKEINALSCSTTFEMGVDVGDLETVFLRNIPPLASNYAQRVGRAGRSINAAAFALTYARLSSHDFTFFDKPEEMIKGVITPPNFNTDNDKILKRHIYAIALGLYLKNHPELYSSNNAKEFINNKGYEGFISWLKSEPAELTSLIKNSITNISEALKNKYVHSFDWVEDFWGEDGLFRSLVVDFEQNVTYLRKEYDKAMKDKDERTATVFKRKLERYEKNDLIDFLVRGNILPKYGFPIDSVELTQNITAKDFKTLNLSRDLSIAIAEYAPSSEVVADGGLYTSRYIRKPIVNKKELQDFDTAYIANCPNCENVNYSNVPIVSSGVDCAICGHHLKSRDFKKSILPKAGFIAEEDVKDVPLTSQERKYKTEAIYIGDKAAHTLGCYDYTFGEIDVHIESTANDSLVVKSTDDFYVCPTCGYSLACDEKSKLREYKDYKEFASKIEDGPKHKNPFGKGNCSSTILTRYCLHHEFKTDVAKISFSCDSSNYATMLSVMYAILNSFATELNIERRDIKACLTYKQKNGVMEHKIIIYDAVPGGAGHSRRLVTEDGQVLRKVIKRAYDLLNTCHCEPSCYRCIRNYENQKMHEILDRKLALSFLEPFISNL